MTISNNGTIRCKERTTVEQFSIPTNRLLFPVWKSIASSLHGGEGMRCAIRKYFTSGSNTRIFANNCPFGRK